MEELVELPLLVDLDQFDRYSHIFTIYKLVENTQQGSQGRQVTFFCLIKPYKANIYAPLVEMKVFSTGNEGSFSVTKFYGGRITW